MSWGPTAAVIGDVCQFDSAAREMASRYFLHWHDAATVEEGNGGKDKDKDEEEAKKSELEDMFVASFWQLREGGERCRAVVGGLFYSCDGSLHLKRHISHFPRGLRTVCLFVESVVISCRCHAILHR